MIISKIVLFPYWLVLKMRNNLYDKGIKKSYRFDVPLVCIGNVTVGGTGKTPMAEYTIKSLKDDFKLAVLSYGYKRKSRGFHIVDHINDSARDVGDEPLQIKRKFPDIIVAVDKKRRRAIETLMALPEPPQVIILDDAFQHRSIVPDINIGLIDFSRPIFKDELIPLGKLRDLPQQIRRAQAIVISKTPDYTSTEQLSKVARMNRVKEDDNLFFTKIAYGTPLPIFEGIGNPRYKYSKEVILFTGIANEKPLKLYLYGTFDYIYCKKYSDHHYFKKFDMKVIGNMANLHSRALLLTTEKDAQRLIGNPAVPDELKTRMLYIPVETEFLSNEERENFDRLIRNCIVKRLEEIRIKKEKESEDDPNNKAPQESCGFVKRNSLEKKSSDTDAQHGDVANMPVEVEAAPVVIEEQLEQVEAMEEREQHELYKAMPIEIEEQYEQIGTTPVEIEEQSEQIEAMPVEIEEQSEQIGTTPVEIEEQPEQIEAIPVEIEEQPEQIEAMPVEIEKQPEVVEKQPEEVGCASAEAEKEQEDPQLYAQLLYEKVRARLYGDSEDDDIDAPMPVEIYEESAADDYMESYEAYSNQNEFTPHTENDFYDEDDPMMPVEIVEEASSSTPEPIVYSKEKQEDIAEAHKSADVVPGIVITNAAVEESTNPVYVATLQKPVVEKSTETPPQHLARAVSLRKSKSKKKTESVQENLLF